MTLLLRLDSPAGYVCRILRTKNLEIPSQITQFSTKALPVIMLAWKAKVFTFVYAVAVAVAVAVTYVRQILLFLQAIVRNMIEFIEQKQYLEVEESSEDRLRNLQNS